jgi:hypothetical protein
LDVGRSVSETSAVAGADGCRVGFGEPGRKCADHRKCAGQSKWIAFRDRGGFATSLMALELQRARGRNQTEGRKGN